MRSHSTQTAKANQFGYSHVIANRERSLLNVVYRVWFWLWKNISCFWHNFKMSSSEAQNTLQPGQRIKPNVSVNQAKKLIEEYYELNVESIRELNSYDDNNFYVKVHTHTYSARWFHKYMYWIAKLKNESDFFSGNQQRRETMQSNLQSIEFHGLKKDRAYRSRTCCYAAVIGKWHQLYCSTEECQRRYIWACKNTKWIKRFGQQW